MDHQRIFFLSLGEEQGKYLLQLISCGLSGEQMKRIFCGLGPSNSGKSIISKAILLSMRRVYLLILDRVMKHND